jgi:hypothetical protein
MRLMSLSTPAIGFTLPAAKMDGVNLYGCEVANARDLFHSRRWPGEKWGFMPEKNGTNLFVV